MVNILLGESSSGKDFLLKKIISDYNYTPIISYTTRPIRDGETDGVEYNFVTKDEFLSFIDNDELIEYRKYETLLDGNPDVWYYGLRKQEFDSDKNYIVILDVNGAKDFIKYAKIENCNLFYIYTPSKLREERARKRGSFSDEEWYRRLEDDRVVFSDENMEKVLGKRVYKKVKFIYNYSVAYVYNKRTYVNKDIEVTIKEVVP